MRMTGRRESSNVNDRRGGGGGGMFSFGKLGLGGAAVVAIVVLLMGGNLGDVLNIVGGNMDFGSANGSAYEASADEEQLAKFASQVLAGTEDVWTAEFKKIGKEYIPPKLVLFTGSVQSGCGGATSSVGPFYCSADQTVYIDLSFFTDMKRNIGADGDFAYAYVIAHEVGHHVQYLLGTLDAAHSQMSRVSQKEANRISVRLELQADYFAGMWAHRDNEMFSSLEDGDIEEGVNAASKIGDDYLQKKSQGYAVPDSFNHGTSAQRIKWLKRGVQLGSFSGADTFSPAYDDL
ncbi:MAG: neutral zinc metallopeptidase [Muribaculaceae bacterium]